MIERMAGPDLSFGAQEVRARVSEAAFGSPLVVNHFRGLVAEAIVASALEPEWTWCSADWAGWDFERADGLRLEVKQSASRQTWTVGGGAPSTCRFDIRARTGSNVGSRGQSANGRAADIYVFAHHFDGSASADHCDPAQWRFFVLPERPLPRAKTIGLRGVEKLAEPCSVIQLPDLVDACALGVALEMKGRPAL